MNYQPLLEVLRKRQKKGEFLRLHKSSQHITSANEATLCEYISRIIYGVTSIYGGEILGMKSQEVMAKVLLIGL